MIDRDRWATARKAIVRPCAISDPPAPDRGAPRRVIGAAMTLLAAGISCAGSAAAQNSTRKLRQQPSATAERAGTAVPWRESLEAALLEARESKRPVFWFVPSVAGSPMDRKPEIARYLAAGPFSWPSTIELLAQRFVPVQAVPRGDLQRKYGLVRGSFLEPGWLVLDGDGKELARLDRITTLQPEWFEAPLRRLVGAAPPPVFGSAPLAEAWAAYRTTDHQACLAELDRLLGKDPAPEVVAEAMFLRGAVECRQNRTSAARATWTALAERHPESTWAAKAAMEAEGHGPFARGFEDFVPVPERMLRESGEGSRAPIGSYTEAELWQRGVAFLLALGDEDGALRDSIYDFGGTDSLPNVHAAITFLAGEALLCALERATAGTFQLDAAQRDRVEQRLDRILALAIDEQKLALEDRDEILWARAYAVRFLARWARTRQQDAERLQPHLRNATAAVVALQPQNGVWFHEYGNPFAIATALQALAAARDLGIEVPGDTIERGLRALVQCRAKNGAYTYSHPRSRPANAQVEAAAGRMPICELALLLWGHADQERLTTAVRAGLEHHRRLEAVRKYDDHADELAYGGFFFWFDMLGRSEAIRQLTDVPERDLRTAQQKKLVLDLPEIDGCFVDSHELGRGYGTAMALLCLATLGP